MTDKHPHLKHKPERNENENYVMLRHLFPGVGIVCMYIYMYLNTRASVWPVSPTGQHQVTIGGVHIF